MSTFTVSSFSKSDLEKFKKILKNFVILFLIFSMLLIPVVNQIEAQLVPTISLDKATYDIYDTIKITGNTDYPEETFSFHLFGHNGTAALASDDITSDIDANFYYEIVIFELVDTDYDGKPIPVTSGDYWLRAYGLTTASITEIYFQVTGILDPNPLTIQTDKTEYYVDDPISINGTITEIDELADTTITYDITFLDEIIQTGDSDTLQEDGTFNFIVDTTLWDHTGNTIITIEIQGFTADANFYYYDLPDMTPEALFEMIMAQYDIIDDIRNELTTLQSSMDILITLVEELIGQQPPLPLDAPIITAFIVDDPDDLDDVYSVDDTLTIQFDSDTNEPGGNGVQTKPEVNNLFAFTESIGQAYSGQWITPDTFLIIINSISTPELIINQTTVTPAGIMPIYPADGTLDASHVTSPPLTGDFGDPLD